jgi:ABC-type transport system involved in multi-copper enzyme maturation permease subunit
MIGKVFFMEFRTGWKGILIFLLLVLLIAGGMPGIFPSFKESFESDLEGEENLEISIPDEKGDYINLSWEPLENVSQYMIVESNVSYLFPFINIYSTNNSNISILYDFDEERYYLVAAMVNGSESPMVIGITTSSGDRKSAIDEFLENPAYKGLTGGRVISFSEIKGFISLEFYSWWVLLAGLFLAYIAVSSVSGDFEGKRMDLIFSTPIKREQYLLEKFTALTVITFVIILFAAGALASGIDSIGYSDELDANTIFLSLIGSLPMLLVIMAIGVLSAVQFGTTRAGMGIAFLFVMIEFILYTLSGFSSVYEGAKYATVLNYWDYNDVLYDGVFDAGHFIGLFVVAGIILVLAVYLFKKKDIPA